MPLGQMDRAAMETYHETSVVKEMLQYNSLYIEEIVKRNLGRFFVFPCDGAGTGARICRHYSQSFASGDLCPRGEDVAMESFRSTILRSPIEGLVVLSFAMSFLSQSDLQALKGRDVVCIDRHHCDHWNLMTSDNVVSGNISLLGQDPILPQRDNSAVVPRPYLPMFLTNKRPCYVSKLSHDDLISFLRFLKLHKWTARIAVDDSLKDILAAYGFVRLAGDRFEDTIANDPFHAIDYYNGINYRDRVMIKGIPRECNLNHVLCLNDEPTPGVGCYEKDGKYFLRFRESGTYHFYVYRRWFTIVVQDKVRVNWSRRKKVASLVDLRPAYGSCETVDGIDMCDISSPVTPNEILFYRNMLDIPEG